MGMQRSTCYKQNNGRAASCVHSMCIGQKLKDQGCCRRTFCNSTIFRCAQRKDTSSSNRSLRAGCRVKTAASILHTLSGARLSLTMSTQRASRLGTTLATACKVPCMRALCSHCYSVLQSGKQFTTPEDMPSRALSSITHKLTTSLYSIAQDCSSHYCDVKPR